MEMSVRAKTIIPRRIRPSSVPLVSDVASERSTCKVQITPAQGGRFEFFEKQTATASLALHGVETLLLTIWKAFGAVEKLH
jgi:hypothetical protein